MKTRKKKNKKLEILNILLLLRVEVGVCDLRLSQSLR